jgi:hypothetical protein
LHNNPVFYCPCRASNKKTPETVQAIFIICYRREFGITGLVTSNTKKHIFLDFSSVPITWVKFALIVAVAEIVILSR